MVNFNFSFDPGTTLQQMVGFEIAGRVWSSYLTDPITVNLQVGVSSSLGSKVIGGALPGMNAQQSYSSFTSALAADAKSVDDRAAIREVTGSSFSADYEFTQNGFLKVDGKGSSSALNLTRAEAKALGLSVSGFSSSLDGYILFGSLAGSSVQWNYDYTRSAAAPANSLDFLTTAMHEIGHVLGFVSGLDSPGWVDATLDSGLLSVVNDVLSQLNAVTASASPLDLFRYDTNIFNLSDNRTLSLGGTKVFALDNLNTPIASFATGSDTTKGGNGYQASHWAAGTNSLMAPTLKTGTRSAISAIDLKAFDVLGWDLAPNGINTAINLTTLQTQSKQSLATRLGQTVGWLDANSTTAAQQLAQDGSLAVLAMAIRSQVYDLNRITPATPGATTSLVYNQLFQEQGLFETIDELEVVPTLIINLPSLDLNKIAPPTPRSTPAGTVTLPSLDLNKITPPTPGGTVSLIINLPSLDLNKITPPTPGGTPSVTVTLTSSLSQSVQALNAGAAITATSNSLLTGKTSYFYGSGKPVAYTGSAQSAQPQFAPSSVLVNLSALL